MAKLEFELPNDLIKSFENLGENTERMMEEMTDAGAEVVLNNIKKNAPAGVKSSKMINCLKKTKTYKTPSDGGINTKVAFYGYFQDSNGVKKPAPLVANVFEFGRSGNAFPKKPFVRKSFNKSQITKAMEEIQEKYLPKE